MLSAVQRSDLEHYWTIRQATLRRKKNTSARTTAQFANEAKLAQLLAADRKLHALIVELQKLLMAIQHHPQRCGPLRKTPQDALLDIFFAGGLSLTIFLVNHINGGLRTLAKLRMAAQHFLCAKPL